LSFDDRPRTCSPKNKLRQNSSILSNLEQDDFLQTDYADPGTTISHSQSMGSIDNYRPTTTPQPNRYYQPSSSAILSRPSTTLGNASSSKLLYHLHTQSVPQLPFPHEDPFSAARPSTTESNNGLTHLKLHVNAAKIPPGGFRQRPTSRGVISSVAKKFGDYKLRPKTCLREYYDIPDRGAFGLVHGKQVVPKIHTTTSIKTPTNITPTKINRSASSKTSSRPSSQPSSQPSSRPSSRPASAGGSPVTSDEKEDDETKPLLLVARLNRFKLGRQIEVREIDHKFTGLFRPSFVHHIHNTGFLDIQYPVDGLKHYRFHIDPRAARQRK